MLDAGVSPLLEVDIRRKARGRGNSRTEIIDGLAFTVTRGCVTCLFGPSGCGKSTALRIVMGLDPDYEGRIEPPASGLRLGVVFQDPRLLPWRTVAENVRLAAPAVSQATLDSLLGELGLAQWHGHRPNQLSLGMQRRVALARALIVEPELLVLDEAFVSLDERSADSLRTAVFAAVERRRATVLMVTHNIGEALSFSDTILVLAPRPTRVLDAVRLDTPRAGRDEAWIVYEKGRLAATSKGFFDSNI